MCGLCLEERARRTADAQRVRPDRAMRLWGRLDAVVDARQADF